MLYSSQLPIVQAQPEQHMVWGWANVATKDGLPVVDRQGDVVDIEELRKAAHNFMENHRDSGDMHNVMGVGRVVESIVLDNDLQKALGIDLGQEGWFIGVKVSNEGVWKRIKSGELSAFSIGGGGRRTELTAAHKALLGVNKRLQDTISRVKKDFDPNEARDNDGEWTGPGSGATATAKPPNKTRTSSKVDSDGVVLSKPNIHGPENHIVENARVLSLAAKHPFADPFADTSNHVLATSGKYKTGQPVDMGYLHNNEKAPNMGTVFGQHIEPKGTYMYPGEVESFGNAPHAYGDFELGAAHFKNPIVLDYVNTRESGWKKKLSDAYGGRTGRQLTNAIIQSGHDGIITIDTNGRYAPEGFPIEAINLTAPTTIKYKSTSGKPIPEDDKEFADLFHGSNLKSGVGKFNQFHSPLNGEFTTGSGVTAVSTAPPATAKAPFHIDYGTTGVSKYETRNTLAAYAINSRVTPTQQINTPERRNLRRSIEKELYGTGAKQKNKRIDIVLGNPGAGKTTSVASNLISTYGSLQIDPDDAKRDLPEYSDPKFNVPGHVGSASGAIHEESSNISNEVFRHAIRKGDNIVLPMIGKNIDSIESKIGLLDKLGYEVHVHMVNAPLSVTIPRTIDRWEAGKQGYVSVPYQEALGTKSLDNFNRIRHDSRIAESTLIDSSENGKSKLVDRWINPDRRARKLGVYSTSGRLAKLYLGRFGSRAGTEWFAKFGRSGLGYESYIAKFNHIHDPKNGQFASNGAAADKPSSFISQEAESTGSHGFVHGGNATSDQVSQLNHNVEKALTDGSGRDLVSGAMQKFFGSHAEVTAKREGRGVFMGKVNPNTSIEVRKDVTDDQLDKMAAIRGLLTGQEAQIWSRRHKKSDPDKPGIGVGYVVHGGTSGALAPLTADQYSKLNDIIKSNKKFAPLDGSTFKDGSFLFRNVEGKVPEKKYAKLLNKATQRLHEQTGAKVHISLGRYSGNYITAPEFLGIVGRNADALRWTADNLSQKTGPTYVQHAKEIGADTEDTKARIAASVARIRAAADAIDPPRQRIITPAHRALLTALGPIRERQLVAS